MRGPTDIGGDGSMSRKELGEQAESVVVRYLHDIEDHEILTQHAEGSRPQGLDIESLGPDGRAYITEVKGTSAQDWHPPRMTRNASERQMSETWVVDTAGRDGQVDVDGPYQIGDGPDQVALRVVQVDMRRDTLSVWDRVGADGRLDTSQGPAVVHKLSDVEAAFDAGQSQDMSGTVAGGQVLENGPSSEAAIGSIDVAGEQS